MCCEGANVPLAAVNSRRGADSRSGGAVAVVSIRPGRPGCAGRNRLAEGAKYGKMPNSWLRAQRHGESIGPSDEVNHYGERQDDG